MMMVKYQVWSSVIRWIVVENSTENEWRGEGGKVWSNAWENDNLLSRSNNNCDNCEFYRVESSFVRTNNFSLLSCDSIWSTWANQGWWRTGYKILMIWVFVLLTGEKRSFVCDQSQEKKFANQRKQKRSMLSDLWLFWWWKVVKVDVIDFS